MKLPSYHSVCGHTNSYEAKNTSNNGNEDARNSSGKKIGKEEDEEEEENLITRRKNITEGGSDSGSGSGSGSGESRACAACKYQRRRCKPDCPLSPYFPAERHQQFLNVHRLFGLKNICKVLKKMKSPDRDLAIKSMIYEADVRSVSPVQGCYGVVRQLTEQIARFQNELNHLQERLEFYRQFVNNNSINNSNLMEGEKENYCSSTSADDALNLNFYNSMDDLP